MHARRSHEESWLGQERRAVRGAGPEERRFRQLVESFAQAIWEADAAGELIRGSAYWPGSDGSFPEEWLGRGWLNAVHDDDRAWLDVAWRRAVRARQDFNGEFRVRLSPDSRWFWTRAHATLLKNDDGSPLKWLGLNLDIAMRKNAEQALREADRQKDEFIAVLAHELRNPLAPIRSSVELLLTDTATSTSRTRAIAVIGRQTLHMARLVEDLVDASRITTGRLQIHLQPARLADILKASVEAIQPALLAKRQSVSLSGLDVLDPSLDGDAIRLSQAFVNILNNSSKFSPESSPIGVQVAREGEAVSIRIRDAGRGIPESDLPNIFRLFVQSARHDRGDGLGIGLALVNEVVKLHGGTIEARNAEDGPGAVFEVRLPVLSFHGLPAAAALTPAPVAWRSLRILVVDDSPQAAEALGALLELTGHTIRIAHNGAQAVEEAGQSCRRSSSWTSACRSWTGLEATRKIRALDMAVRPYVVAVTGWSSVADREESRQAGCDLHLVKPVGYADVVAAVERSGSYALPTSATS